MASWVGPEPFVFLAIVFAIGGILLYWDRSPLRDVDAYVFGAALIAGLVIAVLQAFSA